MATLEIDNLTKEFGMNTGIVPRLFGNETYLQAVRNISLQIRRGETLGLVGESGAGKSTVGNLITRQYKPTSGSVRYEGENVHKLKGNNLAKYRQSVQMVFQDSNASLDPRYRIGTSVAEPLKIHTSLDREARSTRVVELLEMVNLEAKYASRYPRELSGGQLQRVSLATALAVNPELIILDEPVSALDVSVQASILNLLIELQENEGLSFLLITHNLNIIKHISDRVAIMYLGEIVEKGHTETLFDDPAHPYTEALLESIPKTNGKSRDKDPIKGEIPSPINPPTGCAFHTRCKYATEKCTTDDPALVEIIEGRETACHYWNQVVDQSIPDSSI